VIGLVIAALVALYVYWDKVVEYIKRFGKYLLIALGPIGLVIGALILLYKYWDDIVAVLKKGWEWVKKMKDVLLLMLMPLLLLFAPIIAVVGAIYLMIKYWKDINKVLNDAWLKVKTFFVKLWDDIGDVLKGAWDSVKAWAKKKWDDFLAGLGVIQDALKEAMKTIVDYVLSLLPGGKTIKEAATATKEENDARRAKEGSTISGGIGSVLGGQVWSGSKEIVKGAGNAIGSFFKSISPFASGTNKILNDGFAKVHAGEAIVPSNIAKGNGPFNMEDSGIGKTLQDITTAIVSSMMPRAKASGKAQGTASATDAKTGMAATSANADLDERIEQRVQNARPTGAAAAANEELVKIAVNTDKLVMLTNKQNELLEDILGELEKEAPVESGGGEYAASNNPIKLKPKYYKWKQARQSDGPSKQVINAG
jgi:hypothetical protein